MLDINKRLDNIEERLLGIEIKLGIAWQPGQRPQPEETPIPKVTTATAQPPEGSSITSGMAAPAAAVHPRQTTSRSIPIDEPVSATQLMAWAAGFILLLAAVYFLKLVYDAGWLTPLRQVGMAGVGGIALIVAGVQLARIDRGYAAYLPGVGLVILYLTTYAGHLYYALFDTQIAVVAAGAISVAGIWLGRRFDNSIYVIFAASGVYLTPILLRAMYGDLLDLIIYYSAWSLLFSFCALQEGRRITYILPMFFALLGFDIVWRLTGQGAWVMAASYQFIQFAIFATTAAAFSVIHQRPLDNTHATAHGIALVSFYVLEYTLLKQHIPDWAPILGLLSAVLVYAIYLAADTLIKGDRKRSAGAVIVSAYCSIVTAHTVFIELLPGEWFSWAALFLPAAIMLLSFRFKANNKAFVPILITAGLIFGVGYIKLLVTGRYDTEVFMPNLALVLYAVMLYAAYFQFSRQHERANLAPMILYSAHLAFMVCSYRIIDSGLILSLTWAVFAVLVLIVAIKSEDKVLGQSSLLIFCASGLKVLLHDLSGSGSMVRVIILIILGVSLYVGGWLYQTLVRGIGNYHNNPVINRQINTIKRLLDKGLTAGQIAHRLKADGVPYLGEGEWTEERVAGIVQEFSFQK